MFANTLTLTINAVDKVLGRRNQDNFGSVYRYLAGDGSELITMKIRHSVDSTKDGEFSRSNVMIERIVYATPTTAKQMYTVTFTVRRLENSSPDSLLHLLQGASALLATIDQDLVLGDN